MRRTYSIMKWACAVVLITGMGLTTAHGAKITFKNGLMCWVIDNNTGTHCTDLGSLQCQTSGNGGDGKPCNWCANANQVLFVKTCVPTNDKNNPCGTDGQSINCGNSYVGSCLGKGCSNPVLQGSACSTIFNCNVS
jgi:hypothetical protein